jgi:hypothetical protein
MELSRKIRDLIHEYAKDNLHGISEEERELLSEFIDSLTSELLSGDIAVHDQDRRLEVLAAYCRQMKVCRDFVTF